MTLRKFTLTFLVFLFSLSTFAANKRFTVVIDPGHGGGDAGTPHRKCKQDEKTIALHVALRLGRLIEARHSDVNVIYTRRTDRYPSLPDRVQIAKKAKGDLFISVHVNACPDASVYGFETYVFGNVERSEDGKKRLADRLVEERENLDISGRRVNFDTDIDIETKILCQAQREKHNKQSMEVARAVQQSVIANLKQTSYARSCRSRGVKAKNLFVLCFSPMPAILVELGYMSNPAEERFLNSDEAQMTFAQGIYEGFKKYKQQWDKRQLSHADSRTVAPAPAPEPEAEEDIAEAPTRRPAATSKSSNRKPSTGPAEAPKADNVNKAPTTGKTVWKIQFLTSPTLYKEDAPELKGLSPVSYYKDGKLYKYTYGCAATNQELTQSLKYVLKKFPDAFYIQMDGKGRRIR